MGTGQCALGAIRSIKDDKNIKIIVIGNEKKGLAQYSRYVDTFYPCNENDINNIYSVLDEINKQYDKIILIPTGSDFWVNIIIKAPGNFDNFITDIDPQYSKLMEKSYQQKLAEECGVPYPESYKICNNEDLNNACRVLHFPCVVKPVSRVVKELPFRIRSYKTPENLIKDIVPFLGQCDFLASTQIVGEDKRLYTYGSLAVGGNVTVEYSGRKLTQRPMQFGVAGIAESIALIEEIQHYSKELLKKANFSGISQIEFKQDKHDGKYYLMEINPRIWLWAQIATESGVNLPLAYYYYLSNLGTVKYVQNNKKVMFISGLSLFDNTFREKNFTWIKYYFKSRFVKHIYGIKSLKDMEPYRVERKRFLKKIIHKTKNNM